MPVVYFLIWKNNNQAIKKQNQKYSATQLAAHLQLF